MCAAEAGRGAAQVMLERDIQATLRSWQAHLAAAALIFVQVRRRPVKCGVFSIS